MGRFTLLLLLASVVVTHSSVSRAEVSQQAIEIQEIEKNYPVGWLREFEGKIRVWNCSWYLDSEGAPIPKGTVIVVSEHTLANDAYSQIQTMWRWPLRDDLTPDLNYVHSTAECLVIARGNSPGPRAVVYSPLAEPKAISSLSELLTNPIVSFVDKPFAVALGRLRWTPRDPEEAASLGVGDVPFLSYSSDGLLVPDEQVREVQAQLICRAGPTIEATPDNVSQFIYPSTRGVPVALDVSAHLFNGRPEWTGRSEASYRVLEWQKPDALRNIAASAECIPRLVVWAEDTDRPLLPSKSFLRRNLMLVDIQPEEGQALPASWKSVLPQLRVLDLRTNVAAVIDDISKDECEAWQFVQHIGDLCQPFESLLKSDLCASHPRLFEPASTFIERNGGQPLSPIGTFQRQLPFQALPLAEIRLAAGAQASLSTNEFLQRLKQTWGIDRPGDQQLQAIPDNDAALVNPTPGILKLVGQIRSQIVAHEQKGQELSTPRKGYEPVARENIAKARRTMGGLLILTFLAISVCLAIHLRSLRRPVAMTSIVLAWIFFGVTHSRSALAAGFDVADGSAHEVKEILQKHCEILAAFTAMNPRELWDVLEANHRRVVQNLSSDASPADLESTMAVVETIRRCYGEIVFRETDPQASTLASVLLTGKANCYTLSHGLALHCRLLGIPTRLVAIKEHVLLALVALDDAGDGSPRVMRIYDPVKSKWLTTAEQNTTLSNHHIILDDDGSLAIGPYNVGTLLCLGGDATRGAPLLEKSLAMGFASPAVLQNLANAYLAQQRYAAVTELVETRLRSVFADAREHSGPSNVKVIACADEAYIQVQLAYLQALIRLNRLNEAVHVAENAVLAQGFAQTDFELYRLYLALRHAQGQAAASHTVQVTRGRNSLRRRPPPFESPPSALVAPQAK
jgi:hypothetical protein